MERFTTSVGIGISKRTFDACIWDGQKPGAVLHQVSDQTERGYQDLMDSLAAQEAGPGSTLICMEHAGIYIHGLLGFLCSAGLDVWVEMPLRTKKSMGLQRGR